MCCLLLSLDISYLLLLHLSSYPQAILRLPSFLSLTSCLALLLFLLFHLYILCSTILNIGHFPLLYYYLYCIHCFPSYSVPASLAHTSSFLLLRHSLYRYYLFHTLHPLQIASLLPPCTLR